MNQTDYKTRLKGAIYGRFAGCALGAPVEMMPLDKLEQFVESIGDTLPPQDYFKEAPNPDEPRYMYGKGRDFTRTDMKYLSTDDDIMYTLLSVMILEEYGIDFTTEQVARMWMKYLPLECTYTAERITLANLQQGIAFDQAGILNNNMHDFIGAAIRIDGYAYVSPGNPKQAVLLAQKDARLSHREDGLFSAMYFAAVISMAFTEKNLRSILQKALHFIPENSVFTKHIQWSIEMFSKKMDYKQANKLVTERFPDMEWAHAINNACLTVWGILLGEDNFEKGITETVAMAYDNDCTAATVGSVLGAYHGVNSIDPKWYRRWHDRGISYLKGIPEYSINFLIERFAKIGTKTI